MRAVVMRVSEANVRIDGEMIASIGRGVLVLLGVGLGDTPGDADSLARKIALLRVFPDEKKPMNRSVLDVSGEALVVSQFTLLADTSRGRRPSFVRAAPPETAERLYLEFIESLKKHDLPVASGRFGESMAVSSVNDGPVTVLLCTRPEDVS